MEKRPRVKVKNLNPDVSLGNTGGGTELRRSNFFITINTNKTPDDSQNFQDIKNALNRAIEQAFQTPEVFVKFLVPGHRWNSVYIQDTSLKYGIEIGPKQMRVHAHLLYSVKHYSLIQIDINALKALILSLIDANLGIASLYINVRAVRNNKTIEDYITKSNNTN